MALTIRVRKDLCCAAGLCVQVAPEIYRLDELGYNASDGQELALEQRDLAKKGARVCPEGAIAVLGAG